MLQLLVDFMQVTWSTAPQAGGQGPGFAKAACLEGMLGDLMLIRAWWTEPAPGLLAFQGQIQHAAAASRFHAGRDCSWLSWHPACWVPA